MSTKYYVILGFFKFTPAQLDLCHIKIKSTKQESDDLDLGLGHIVNVSNIFKKVIIRKEFFPAGE